MFSFIHFRIVLLHIFLLSHLPCTFPCLVKHGVGFIQRNSGIVFSLLQLVFNSLELLLIEIFRILIYCTELCRIGDNFAKHQPGMAGLGWLRLGRTFSQPGTNFLLNPVQQQRPAYEKNNVLLSMPVSTFKKRYTDNVV